MAITAKRISRASLAPETGKLLSIDVIEVRTPSSTSAARRPTSRLQLILSALGKAIY